MSDILDVALRQCIGGADGELVDALCAEIARLRNKQALPSNQAARLARLKIRYAKLLAAAKEWHEAKRIYIYAAVGKREQFRVAENALIRVLAEIEREE